LWQTKCKAYILNAPVEITLGIHVDASYREEGLRSQTDIIIQIGGQTIHWYTRRQDLVALSIIEAEYIPASEGGKDAAWIQQLMIELGETIIPTIRFDNEAVDKLTKTSVFHRRTRHIEHCFHYIREEIEKGYLRTVGIQEKMNLADPLNKILPGPTLSAWKETIGVKSLELMMKDGGTGLINLWAVPSWGR
jgi:hypothetical protein